MDWLTYAKYGTESGEGDARRVTYIYGAWTVIIGHGHGMRQGNLPSGWIKEWGLTPEEVKGYRSGHKSGRPFSPDITTYGISEADISAAILEDLFEKLDYDSLDDSQAKGLSTSAQRSVSVGGTAIQYRYNVKQLSIGVGTYFLA